jgi:WD40 repeat protein
LATDGTILGTLDHAANVLSIDFSPDGHTLVTGDMNHEVQLWDVERRQKRATLRGHEFWVEAVRFSPDGKTIASCSDDGTVRLWRSTPPE